MWHWHCQSQTRANQGLLGTYLSRSIDMLGTRWAALPFRVDAAVELHQSQPLVSKHPREIPDPVSLYEVVCRSFSTRRVS